ncbi:hypothetical protein [Mesobacillus maritimus]|uniref:DUF3278 domain-containing protein n=1 Tax=Mesobacillus maritimus TaxID=1643336 RepID=A0ABS7KBR7_9BACI|nr:hypothetical protein [Mesobacillus maritimus]MBY0099683.1 hypothetical protein [Mesobacillus maritimus]
MRTWISFLLPEDEYKEKRVLHFLSEGSIILLISLVSLFISSRYLHFFQIDLEFALFISIILFLGYVFLRYIYSGMEYTDVATEGTYKQELKKTFRGTCLFVGTFTLVYLVFEGIPNNLNEWIETIGLPLTCGLVWYFFSFVSIKKSYKKNKELL